MTDPETTTEHVALRMPSWLVRQLDDEAARLGETRSAVIRAALRHYVDHELATKGARR